MDKKTYVQIVIIFIIFSILTFVYIYYFSESSNTLSKLEKEKTDINIVKGSEDLISEMSYFSEDNKGNRYEIKSEYGVINPDKSNLICQD